MNGIFLPGVVATDDIRAVVSSTTLPLNVMCMPTLPDFAALKQLGVKRISMGNFLNKNAQLTLEQQAKRVTESGSFVTIFR